jgi:type II secretion system protein G
MSAPQRHSNGFTLIEILVVIVVIAVLASIVAPNVFTHVAEAKHVTARSQIEMLGAALDAYRLDKAATRPPSKGSPPCGSPHRRTRARPTGKDPT